MTTAYTSLLGLALPVQGELSGTWGDTVNTSITSLLDTSVAGTTNVSTDADVTLTTTTGAANTARQAILLFSGARTALRTVTAPAQSKIYTVINATTGGFSVKLVGAGPTTGLTIPNGASAVVAWNGSDFVEVGSGSIGNLTVNGNLTVTGTSTLTGAITNTAGTANGVAFLNASKVLTTGSALTFDGSFANLTLTSGTTANGFLQFSNSADGGTQGYIGDSKALISGGANSSLAVRGESNILFGIASAEVGRFTSTGLGIGTSSPTNPLHIVSNTVSQLNVAALSGNTNAQINFEPTGTGIALIGPANNVAFAFRTNATERLRISADGNLGLGVTPSALYSTARALQMGTTGVVFGRTGNELVGLSSNAYNSGVASTTYSYIAGGNYATNYLQTTGQHQWFTAGLGTSANDPISFTQAMTLDASGNLGVGTTAPFGKLQVSLTDGQTAYFSSAIAALGTTAISLGYATTGGTNAMAKIIGQRINDGSGRSDLALAVRSVDDNASATIADAKLFVSGTNGNVGIGTSSPSQKLEVAGNAKLTGTNLSIVPSTATSAAYTLNTNTGGNFFLGIDSSTGASFTGTAYGRFLYSGGAYPIVFLTNDTERCRIDSSGNLLVGTTSNKTTAFTGNGTGMTIGAALAPTIACWDTSDAGYVASMTQIGADMFLTNTANGIMVFNTNNTERARIDASGNLLVGTTTNTNSSRLVIAGSSGAVSTPTAIEMDSSYKSSTPAFDKLKFYLAKNASETYGFGLGANADITYWAGSSSSGIHAWYTSQTERVRIDSAGNLLVGTLSGVANGGFNIQPNGFGTGQSVLDIGHIDGTPSAVSFQRYVYNNNVIGSITQSGTTAVLYNVTSDQRLKENIVDALEFGSVIDSIKVRSYDWKAEGSHQRAGFIAQELVTVAPEAVHQPADPDEMMAVDYSKLVPMLVKEIQSLRVRVAQLESN